MDLRKTIKNRKEYVSEKVSEQSRDVLKQVLATKMTTIFIGALASVERSMGYLWGEGKDDLTENEKKWGKIYQELRNEILNKGNNQIRAMSNELDKYSVKYNGNKLGS